MPSQHDRPAIVKPNGRQHRRLEIIAMRRSRFHFTLPVLLSGIFPVLCLCAVTSADESTIDYMRAVKPILAARCFSCHGGLKQKSGLRLDTVELMKKGGKNGPGIVPGDSEKSLLIAHVLARHDAARMPPETEGEPLKPKEIALLKLWIDRGAAGPADEKPEVDPKDHWAFKVPVRSRVITEGNP